MEQVRERGNPLKLLNEDLQKKFMYAIFMGATYRLACSYVGISYQTLRNWINKAEKLLDLSDEQLDGHNDKVFVDFYYSLKQVESAAALKWLEKIDKASEIQWQAAAWKLERRHPESYGRDERVNDSENKDKDIDKAKEIVNAMKGEANG